MRTGDRISFVPGFLASCSSSDMHSGSPLILAAISCAVLCLHSFAAPPDDWRREHRIIDLHMHIDAKEDRYARAVRIMDAAGIGIGVNLSGGTVTRGDDGKSQFEASKEMADRLYPGRFVHYMNLDYAGWNEPDFAERAAKQIEDGKRMGAVGFKEYKRLGLFLRDAKKELIKIDDPKLDGVWAKCGELGMPVSIHIADPRAFWLPYDEKNERWTELKDHRSWWFGDATKYPPREELLAALNRVIKRHLRTTFVAVHFANNAEDLDWVDRALDEHPNLNADLAARIPELGRQDPEKLRKLFTKHADRIFFATDFMVYDKLILGSGGDADKPTEDDAVAFYQKCWRWLETSDRNWPHMTPIQGNWTINSIQLPPEVLRKIYFDNARRLLGPSLPLPVVRAVRIARDFQPDGQLDGAEWQKAVPVRVESMTTDGTVRTNLSTSVRVLWSDRFLYLGYECPFTELSVYSPTQEKERIGLWENDVVEAFIGTDSSKAAHYTEYEWAPNGEGLDLIIDAPNKDSPWSSAMEWKTAVDEANRVWRAEVRIPMKSLSVTAPGTGTHWRINFYRHDKSNSAHLAWSPTYTQTFHTPGRFGWIELAE